MGPKGPRGGKVRSPRCLHPLGRGGTGGKAGSSGHVGSLVTPTPQKGASAQVKVWGGAGAPPHPHGEGAEAGGCVWRIWGGPPGPPPPSRGGGSSDITAGGTIKSGVPRAGRAGERGAAGKRGSGGTIDWGGAAPQHTQAQGGLGGSQRAKAFARGARARPHAMAHGRHGDGVGGSLWWGGIWGGGGGSGAGPDAWVPWPPPPTPVSCCLRASFKLLRAGEVPGGKKTPPTPPFPPETGERSQCAETGSSFGLKRGEFGVRKHQKNNIKPAGFRCAISSRKG